MSVAECPLPAIVMQTHTKKNYLLSKDLHQSALNYCQLHAQHKVQFRNSITKCAM